MQLYHRHLKRLLLIGESYVYAEGGRPRVAAKATRFGIVWVFSANVTMSWKGRSETILYEASRKSLKNAPI